MPRLIFRLPFTLAVASMLVACQSYPAPLAPGAGVTAVAPTPGTAFGPQDRRVILKGRVQWSDLRRLMATTSDVAQSATVTMLAADGTPVVAGLADSSGDFTLYEATTPFTPAVDDTYTLEVVRRGATDGSETLLSLRTVVQYTADGWTSVTGTTIVISALTTAVAQLEATDATVGPADVIGTVTGATATAFGDATVADIEAREAGIVAKLAVDVDPNQAVDEVIEGSVTVTTEADLAMLKTARVITGDLTIDYNDVATVNLPVLEEVGGTLTISGIVEDGVGATGLTGLARLRVIGGSLLVYADSLTSLDGLGNVTALPTGLAISGAGSLTSLAGLDGLATTESVQLENLAALDDLSALAALTTVELDFKLVNLGAAGLISLGELTALTTIGGTLDIEHVPSLAGIDAFPALTDLGGLTLLDLPALTSLTGLEGAAFAQATVDTPTAVELTQLPLITDLSGLAGLTNQVHRLGIDTCAALTSLGGLGAVVHLDELYVNATGLTSFAGVPVSLTSIDSLSLANGALNPATDVLTTLSHLSGVTISTNFSLQGQSNVTSLAGPVFATAMKDFEVDDCDGLTTLRAANTELILTLSHGLRIQNNDGLVSLGLTGLDAAAPGVKTIGTVDSAMFTFTGSPGIDVCEVYGLQATRMAAQGASNDFTQGQVDACPI